MTQVLLDELDGVITAYIIYGEDGSSHMRIDSQNWEKETSFFDRVAESIPGTVVRIIIRPGDAWLRGFMVDALDRKDNRGC